MVSLFQICMALNSYYNTNIPGRECPGIRVSYAFVLSASRSLAMALAIAILLR